MRIGHVRTEGWGQEVEQESEGRSPSQQKSEIKAAHNLLILWDCSDLVISDLLDLSLEDKKKFFSHKYESIQFTDDQVELFRLIHKIHRLLKKKFIIGPEIYGMMQKKHEFFLKYFINRLLFDTFNVTWHVSSFSDSSKYYPIRTPKFVI